jgi:NADH:ubiquinone reductase (non-electrogenic)
MASAASLRPLGLTRSLLARRSLTPTSISRYASTLVSRPRHAPRTTFNNALQRTSFRRVQSTEAPLKKKTGAFRLFLRWTWRLTYLSALGGIVYVGYGIWELRHPIEQDEPDPTKKTLVILGMCLAHSFELQLV